MEKLKIVSVVDKTTSKGDPYKVVDVEGSAGIIKGVSAFKFKFPALDTLIVGAEIEGSVVVDGQYKNLVGVIEKPKGNPNYKTQQMEKIMDKKSESIGKFQDNKDLSIKISSTMNKAVEIATSLTTEQWHATTMEEEIRYWREWLWLEWDNTNNIKPF